MAGFSVSVLVSPVVAHPSLRLDGGLKGFFVRSPLGVVFRFSSSLFALRSLRQVVRSSFSVFFDDPRSLLGFLFPLRSVFHPLFFPSFFPMVSVFSLIPFKALFLFVFVPFFRLFALGSTSFPFPFSGFPFVFVFPLLVLFLRVACVFLSVSWISIAVRPFRLRSPIPPLRITSS